MPVSNVQGAVVIVDGDQGLGLKLAKIGPHWLYIAFNALVCSGGSCA